MRLRLHPGAAAAESGGVDSATTTQLKADVAKAFRRASQSETAVDSLQEHLGTMGARLEAVELTTKMEEKLAAWRASKGKGAKKGKKKKGVDPAL